MTGRYLMAGSQLTLSMILVVFNQSGVLVFLTENYF